MTVLLDSNIIIYLGNGTLSDNIVGSNVVCNASVSRIEALGYTDITTSEERRLEALLDTMVEIPLNTKVASTAIRLRQFKKMSLGDAIVAATAQENDMEFWTANTADFEHIEGLKLRNPLKR